MSKEIDFVDLFKKIKKEKISVEDAYKMLLEHGYKVIGTIDGNKSIEEVFEELKAYTKILVKKEVI